MLAGVYDYAAHTAQAVAAREIGLVRPTPDTVWAANLR